MKKMIIILLFLSSCIKPCFGMEQPKYAFKRIIESNKTLNFITLAKQLPCNKIVFFDYNMKGVLVDPSNISCQIELNNGNPKSPWALTDIFTLPPQQDPELIIAYAQGNKNLYIYLKNNERFDACKIIPMNWPFKIIQSNNGSIFIENLENKKIFEATFCYDNKDNFTTITLEQSHNEPHNDIDDNLINYQALAQQNLSLPYELESLNDRDHNQFKAYCWHKTENRILLGHQCGKISIWEKKDN